MKILKLDLEKKTITYKTKAIKRVTQKNKTYYAIPIPVIFTDALNDLPMKTLLVKVEVIEWD